MVQLEEKLVPSPQNTEEMSKKRMRNMEYDEVYDLLHLQPGWVGLTFFKKKIFIFL